MNKPMQRGVSVYLITETLVHDGLTACLGVVALMHGATWLGILALVWAVTEVLVKTTGGVMLWKATR